MQYSHTTSGLITAFSLLSSPLALADYIYDGNYVTYCGQYDALNTTSGLYDIINNAWGDDGSGLTCTTVRVIVSSWLRCNITDGIDLSRRKHGQVRGIQLDLALV